MRKINLKAIFWGLFVGARRRVSDKPPSVSSAASSDRAKAISRTGDRLPQKPSGPPADRLAKRSGGPPVHWVERVRQAAPELLRNGKRDEADATLRPQLPRKVQRKPAPLRLNRPAPALRSPIDSRRKPIMKTESQPDNRGRPANRKQEPSPPSPSGGSRKRAAGASEKNSKPPEPHDTALTVRSGDHSAATQLQISEARPQTNPSFRENLCAFAPSREPGLGEASFSKRREGAKPAKVLLRVEQAIDEPDKDEGRRQVREGAADDLRNHPPLKGDGARTFSDPAFSRRQNFEQENHGQENFGRKDINSRVEYSWDFPPSVEVPESPIPISVEPVKVTQRLATRYPDRANQEARKAPFPYEGASFDSGRRQVTKREDEVATPIVSQVAQDRRAISYDVSAGRWPALFESSEDDYFDDAMAALRELSHRRRLAREQAGSLWSE